MHRTRDDYREADDLNPQASHQGVGRSLTASAGPVTQLGIDVTEAKPGQVVVAVAGEVDMATAPLLERALLRYTECDVIVDLDAVEFLDSSGLRVLIKA